MGRYTPFSRMILIQFLNYKRIERYANYCFISSTFTLLAVNTCKDLKLILKQTDKQRNNKQQKITSTLLLYDFSTPSSSVKQKQERQYQKKERLSQVFLTLCITRDRWVRLCSASLPLAFTFLLFRWVLVLMWYTRTQELRESRGGRLGLPIAKGPYGLCGRKATLNLNLMWQYSLYLYKFIISIN